MNISDLNVILFPWQVFSIGFWIPNNFSFLYEKQYSTCDFPCDNTRSSWNICVFKFALDVGTQKIPIIWTGSLN